MKLRQREFCHNCNQYVIYEFEDITQRQVIICPNCEHEHYREIDEGTLTNIRLQGNQQVIRIIKAPELPVFLDLNDSFLDDTIEIETTEHKVIGKTADGRVIVDNMDGEKAKVISNRRWGRDPRQV